jgi:hypothetical protein
VEIIHKNWQSIKNNILLMYKNVVKYYSQSMLGILLSISNPLMIIYNKLSMGTNLLKSMIKNCQRLTIR